MDADSQLSINYSFHHVQSMINLIYCTYFLIIYFLFLCLPSSFFFFFYNDPAPTEIYPLPLHDPLPISQWFSQAVSDGGNTAAIWYDTRQNTTDGNNYEIYTRQSTDGGVTWGAASALSDVLIPEPVQNDPLVQPFYGGDYKLTSPDPTGGGDTAPPPTARTGGPHPLPRRPERGRDVTTR